MGKPLRQQRRGKGTPRYRFPSHRFRGKIEYFKGEGTVVDILHDRARKPPVAVVDVGGRRKLMIASAGMSVGQKIACRPLGEIPEGLKIYNIELHYGDGGRLCRTSGSSATVIGHDRGKSMIMLPSKQKKTLVSNCRAFIGTVAGFGRHEKPFKKAGSRYYAKKAAGKFYPRTSGIAMNAVDHPLGGSANPGKHLTVSRHMPPGKKVGSISPRRTGKRK